jgi:hypothetical protein
VDSIVGLAYRGSLNGRLVEAEIHRQTFIDGGQFLSAEFSKNPPYSPLISSIKSMDRNWSISAKQSLARPL